jgi:endoglucanase
MAFKATRGTNISHWLSQSDRRGEPRRAFFGKADVQRLAKWGFDHIRLPIDEQQMWNDAGQREEEAWDLMEQAIDWSLAEGLNLIVDLHILRTHYFIHTEEPALFTDPAEGERFAGLWRQLSQRLSRRSTDRVAYELMNEAVAANPEDWNRVANIAFAALRRLEAGRTIVLGSNKWNQCHTFDVLRIPDDRTQILTFHFYNPMLITHYKASWWEGGIYEGPVNYPGLQVTPEDVAKLEGDTLRIVQKENRPYDRAAMLADMAKPLAVRQKTQLPLYCGEFGCHYLCPNEVRFRWYRDIISLFKEQQIGWGNWDYKGAFGLVNREGNSTGVAEVMLGV